MRPTVCVYIATSIDGFIARSDGGLDWLDAMQVPSEDYGYAAFMAEVDALVMGRTTYETVLGFDPWPYLGKRVVVMTHRPITPLRKEEAAVGALGPVLDRLAADGAQRVYLDGGELVRQGLAEGVVDELIVSVVPVMLGKGRPLFGPEVPEQSWTLTGVQGFATGLVQMRYRRG